MKVRDENQVVRLLSQGKPHSWGSAPGHMLLAGRYQL